MPSPDLIYPPRVPGVQDKELIQTVRASGFPKFSKQLMSQARRPELYGITLQPSAADAICTKYNTPAQDAPESRRTRANDGHRFTRQAMCRLSDEKADELELYLKNDAKYRTKSELVDGLITEYMKRKVREITREAHCLKCDSSDDLIFVDGTAFCRLCAAKISISLDLVIETEDIIKKGD